MPLSPEEFQRRLEEISVYDDEPYERCQIIHEAEAEHGNEMLQFRGFLALSDAFKSFFLETIELFNTDCVPKVVDPVSEHFAIYTQRLAHSFQSVCGAERLALCGYPLQGYTILRNVFDNLVLTSAAVQKYTDFYSIEGIVPGSPVEEKSMKKLRKETEYEVQRQMTGSKSGLTQVALEQLAKIDKLYDYEVHGARLSFSASQDWLRGQASLPVVTKYNERHSAMFMNRYSENCWLIHRLLPLMQPTNVAHLNDEWKKKWRIIDDSFSTMVFSLTEQFGKPVGAAVVEFVQTKFPFNADSHFPL